MALTRAMVASRHRMMPIKETITYYVREPGDQFATGVSVSNAEWRPTSMQERQFVEAGIEAVTRTWHLWSDFLGSISPKIGDKLTQSDGSFWLVVDSGLELAGTRWRLTCTKGRRSS